MWPTALWCGCVDMHVCVFSVKLLIMAVLIKGHKNKVGKGSVLRTVSACFLRFWLGTGGMPHAVNNCILIIPIFPWIMILLGYDRL